MQKIHHERDQQALAILHLRRDHDELIREVQVDIQRFLFDVMFHGDYESYRTEMKDILESDLTKAKALNQFQELSQDQIQGLEQSKKQGVLQDYVTILVLTPKSRNPKNLNNIHTSTLPYTRLSCPSLSVYVYIDIYHQLGHHIHTSQF